MRKSETQSANAVEKTIAVVLGGHGGPDHGGGLHHRVFSRRAHRLRQVGQLQPDRGPLRRGGVFSAAAGGEPAHQRRPGAGPPRPDGAGLLSLRRRRGGTALRAKAARQECGGAAKSPGLRPNSDENPGVLEFFRGNFPPEPGKVLQRPLTRLFKLTIIHRSGFRAEPAAVRRAERRYHGQGI